MNKFFDVVETNDDQTEFYIHSDIGQDYWDTSGIGSGEFAKVFNAVDKKKKICLRINSCGGSVYDGLAMYAIIKERGNCVCKIDCMCASIATVIALACDSVEMAKNGTFMIHKPLSFSSGNADEMLRMAALLDMWEDKIVGIYHDKTGIVETELKDMLRAETWLSSDEALKKKFVDSVFDSKEEDCVAAMANLDFSGFKHVPKNLLKYKNKGKDMPPKEHDVEASVSQEEMARLKAALEESQKQNAELNNKIVEQQALQAKAEDARINALVESAVKDGRIKNTDANTWVSIIKQNAETGESALKNLAVPKSNQTVIDNNQFVTELSPCIQEMYSALQTQEPKVRNRLYKENRQKVNDYFTSHDGPKNAITIADPLKQDVLGNMALDEFAEVVAPLSKLFTTMFKGVQFRGTDTITIPYYPNFSQGVQQFYRKGKSPNKVTNPEGYGSGGNYSETSKSILCDQRYKIEFDWDSYELNRLPFFNLGKVQTKMANFLGWSLFNKVQNMITAARYPGKCLAEDIAASNFDSDVISDIKLKCDESKWPKGQVRNFVINSIFENQLRKDPDLKNYCNSGSAQMLHNGELPMISNFNMFACPTIPANSERLSGYVCMPTALGIVTAPITPDPNLMNTKYHTFEDADTGLVLEQRIIGQDNMDGSVMVLEYNMGMAVLESAALLRLVEDETSYGNRNS